MKEGVWGTVVLWMGAVLLFGAFPSRAYGFGDIVNPDTNPYTGNCYCTAAEAVNGSRRDVEALR